MLRVEPVERDGEVRIRLVGELDLASARSTEASIRAYACRHLPLVLDLAALTYCDSQGIQMFFNLALPREAFPPLQSRCRWSIPPPACNASSTSPTLRTPAMCTFPSVPRRIDDDRTRDPDVGRARPGVITDHDLALKVVVQRLPVIDGHDLVGISQAVAAMPDAKIGDLVEAILSVPANG